VIGQCRKCGAKDNLQKHHISYEPEKTVILCEKCHKSLHCHGIVKSGQKYGKLYEKRLKKRKANIAALRGAGYSNVEIGRKMDMPESTVRYHLRKIRERAEETSPYQAFTEVFFNGLEELGGEK